MPTFWMKCPSCGHRLQVKRTGEALKVEKEVVTVEEVSTPMTPMASERVPNEMIVSASSLRPRKETVPAEKDTDTVTYRCAHCGHTWTVDRLTFKRLGNGELRGRIVSEGAP